MSNFPDATNTGVPAGVTLTPSGGLVINTPGAVISGLDIKGSVYINADNVTLINCRITSNSFHVVQIASSADGVLIQNCEINGIGSGNDGSNGIAGHGTFIGNNIFNVENGITLQGSNSLIQDNYIHDLKASGSPHYDGIQIDGGNSNIVVRHNTVINSNSQTSAVMIDNYFGPIANIVVDQNLLIGGGYSIYVDGQFNSNPISNVEITNNHMGSGYYGITNFNRTSPTYTGNVNDGFTIEQSLGTQPEDITPTPTIASFSTDSNLAGDGITNDNTLRLYGTAPANSTLRVYDEGTQIGSTTADSSGAWSYWTGTVANGNHSFTASATSAGTTSALSSALSVTVDTVAPVAPNITNGTINGNTSVTLTGTAEGNSTVKVFEGATQIGTAAATASGVWSYTTGTLSDGTHNFIAAAMDAAGNTGASAALAVTVQTVGNPTFTGTSGNDVLQGTMGADTLAGGAGDDTYTINNTGDKVVEFANRGIDKVESTISCTLADNVENLQLMGGAQISGTGNGLNNTIIGNDVSNTLTGGAGSDTLNGWGGKDTLFGNSGNDVFQFSSQFSADGDTVADFMPGEDKLDFSKIDASAWNAGDQAFVFDGYTNGGSNGHLWASEDQLAGVTHVYGKTGDFQFHIDLQGTRIGLTASNFTL